MLIFLLTLSTGLVSPIQGSTTSTDYTFHGRGMTALVNVTAPDHAFQVEAMNVKWSTFGAFDYVMIAILVEYPEPWGSVYMPWVAVTDNAQYAALMADMMAAYEIPYFRVVIVEPQDLVVWSCFRRVHVRLNVPVDGINPEPSESPLVIHPFTLRVRGYGWGEWTEESGEMGEYTGSSRSKSYKASATITGPKPCRYRTTEARVGRHLTLTVTSS
jgi:hypothetical protein